MPVPFFLEVLLGTREEAELPTASRQTVNLIPTELAPHLQLGNLLVQGGDAQVQVLQLLLKVGISGPQGILRHLGMHGGRRLLVGQLRHLGQQRLVLRPLLHEILQLGVHASALFLHDVHHTKVSYAFQECLIFLMEHQEGKFIHFRYHASASFLRS